METLDIKLLGNVELYLGGNRLKGFATKKSKALFAYLVLGKGRMYARERLAEAFWGDLPEARARRALSTDLWRIGNLLKDGGADPDLYLVSNTETVGFNANSPHWVDVDAFESATAWVEQINPATADLQLIDQIAESARLYRGDLLEGVYDDWCLIRRDMLEAKHLGALELLMRYDMVRECWSNALEIGQKILSIDPFMEHVQRAVMRCHFSLGNRPAAVMQYATCAKLLRQELDVDPMEETRQVLETIVAAPALEDNGGSNGMRSLDTGYRSIETRLQEINLAIASIDAARNCLISAERQLREQTEQCAEL